MKEKLLSLLLHCGSLEDVGDTVCTVSLGTGVCGGWRGAWGRAAVGGRAQHPAEPTTGRTEGHSTRLSPPQGDLRGTAPG